MTEDELFRDQENEVFGQFLIESIAAPLGLKPDPKIIGKAIFKGTSCGAWVRFDEKGIVVGTIIEGSDAEFSTRVDLNGIEPDAAGATLLNERFWEAVQAAEDFAEEVWAEMDAEEDNE